MPSSSPTNDKQRGELLNGEPTDSVLDAQILIDDWRKDYNTHRQRQSLGDLTPASSLAPGGWRTRSETHKGEP